ncbi:MoxR family ATPase [Candidatus Woesearchaeota archaeon]|nr:MoxR family ATPase [Candidatus Woesearchaeota archaeon]
MEINHKQLEALMIRAYETKCPLMIWGTTGIGKSQTVRHVAKMIAKGLNMEVGENGDEKKFGVKDIRISQLDPSDLRGLPSLQGETTKWLPPNWLPTKGQGVLFFDEINLAPPSIQAAAYQLILDRRLGEYKLPEGWVIFGAGNRLEDRANVFELPVPLKNRFIHCTLKVPTPEDWTEWALENGVDTRIVAYLQMEGSNLFKFPKSDSKDNAFPTPRMWEITSKLIKDKDMKEEEREIAISSAVGEAVANQFTAFLKLQKKINLADLLKNPKKVQTIKDIDLKYSLLSEICEKYRKDKKILQAATEIALYLDPEFAIFLMRMLKSMHTSVNDFKKNLAKLKNWDKIVDKYGKYLIH